MRALIRPRPLAGTITAPASKSEAHRFLICAALSDRPTRLTLNGTSEDIEATADCLRSLGAEVLQEEGALVVTPIRRVPDSPLLDCRESGSTLRFLLPVATALAGEVRFTGSGRLPERPIGALQAAMAQHGVSFSADHLPFKTSGRLQGGAFDLPGDVSSQYVTGLLLTLPLLDGDNLLTVHPPLRSAAYLDITLTALRRFGVRPSEEGGGTGLPRRFQLSGPQPFRSPGDLEVEGDWSGAAFLLAAGALTGPVTVRGLDPASPQGDRRMLDFLKAFGAEVSLRKGAVTVGPGSLRGLEDHPLDVDATPDLLPVLAATAAWASGRTAFVNGGRLRLKESDRIASTLSLIRSLGGRAAETPEGDGLIVHGGGLVGGTAEGFHDHRIVMAAAVAASRCPQGVTVTDAEACSKSYPAFFEDYARLGGDVHVL